MKIQTALTLSNIKTLEDLVRYTSQFSDATTSVVNGRLDFSNLFTQTVSVVFTVPNTTISVAHDLGFVPNGYIEIGKTAAIIIFDGNQANTKTTLFVQASAAGSARLLVY